MYMLLTILARHFQDSEPILEEPEQTNWEITWPHEADGTGCVFTPGPLPIAGIKHWPVGMHFRYRDNATGEYLEVADGYTVPPLEYFSQQTDDTGEFPFLS
jgi:hypothetical protein